MKKLTRKQQIRWSIYGGIISLFLIVGALLFKQFGHQEKKTDGYQTFLVEPATPIMFNGVIEAEKIEALYYDQSLGRLSDLLVKDQQEVKTGDEVAQYQNETAADQAEEQSSSLDKLKFAVESAQQNVDAAYQKKNNLIAKLNTATANYNQHLSGTADDEMKRQEYKSEMTQYEQSIEAQNDVVLQAEQALRGANLDLDNGNQTVFRMQDKANKKITSPIDGKIFLNEKGKTDPSIPYAKIMSGATLIHSSATEYDYAKLKVGQKVLITALSDNQTLHGEITSIESVPDQSSANVASAAASADSSKSSVASYRFTVKPDKNLQYGYNVQVSLDLDEVKVPESAVVKDNGDLYVFRYEKGKAHKVFLKGEYDQGSYLVTEGLKIKDRLIANPDKKIKDGAEVAVIK